MMITNGTKLNSIELQEHDSLQLTNNNQHSNETHTFMSSSSLISILYYFTENHGPSIKSFLRLPSFSMDHTSKKQVRARRSISELVGFFITENKKVRQEMD